MATTTSVGICNRALYKIGSTTITSLTADEAIEDRVCNTVYDDLLQDQLQQFPWPFAVLHAPLVLTSDYDEYNDEFDPNAAATPHTVTAITQANPGVVTTGSATGWSNGVTVEFSDVGGMTELLDYFDGIYTITTVSGTSLTLPVDTTNWSAYTSGGYVRRHAIMNKYDDGYTYDLPSDCLLALHLEDRHDEFEVIGSKLLTTKDEAKLVYVKDESTVTNFGQQFIELLATRIAVEIVIPIKGTDEDARALKGDLIAEYERRKTRAEKIMGKHGYEKYDYEEPWLAARL
jgi:hypothetical protein